MTDLHLFKAETLRQVGKSALLKADVLEEVSEVVIDALIWTSLRGIDSHGVRLLPHYLSGVKAGRLNPKPTLSFEKTGAATGRLDADNTFGHAAGAAAMDHAIKLAEDSGVGAVTVFNSSHCGALSYFAHAAAAKDMIGIVFTHATSRVKTPNSNRAFFGNNPICLVAPMQDEEPFCFDAATTTKSFNEIKHLAEMGKQIPLGIAADVYGNQTIDPSQATQLLPIGDYKGFGLSMMVDILCGILSGMPTGNEVSEMFGDSMHLKRSLGHFFCAFRIEAFREIAKFKMDLQDLANRVRREPAKSEEGFIQIPGDPEKNTARERLVHGIPLEMHVFDSISEEANRC